MKYKNNNKGALLMNAISLVEPVTVCDKSTYRVCEVYLCGGYDSAKNFTYGSSHFFRGHLRNGLKTLGAAAEKGDKSSWQAIREMIKYVLGRGRMKYRYTTFEFCVDSFDSKTLDTLAWDVLAQINDFAGGRWKVRQQRKSSSTSNPAT